MNFASIPPASQEALRRAMEYWVEHWDFECPTLFGIEVEELTQVLRQWPAVPCGTEQIVGLAALGAMRELLYGASSLQKSQVNDVIGLPYEQAQTLCSEVLFIVKPVLG